MNSNSPDDFPCILLVSELESNRVISWNKFAEEFFKLEHDYQPSPLFNFISNASTIFFESYIKPILIHKGEISEIQITLKPETTKKVPAVANAQLKKDRVYWAIYIAQERDKLYQQLIIARENLEEKTQELLLLSRQDPLTQLLNRRAAIEDLSNLIGQLKRSYLPINFILIDIDFFKSINDEHGHANGDKVLVELAKKLTEISRSTDIVSRWGGEEFLIILYNSEIDQVKIFCNRIHEAVNQITISNTDNKLLTVSIGVAYVNEEEINNSDIIAEKTREADTALYQAKEDGRNQTIYA